MDRHREINDDCARRWLAELEQLKAERDRGESDGPVGLLLGRLERRSRMVPKEGHADDERVPGQPDSKLPMTLPGQ
jgi:hypothetical protein